jgi:hypothetical protein
VQRRRIAKDLRVGNRGRQLLDRRGLSARAKKRRRSNINRRHQLTDSANRPEISERGLIELLLNVAKILDPMISSTHIPHWTISTHNLFQFFYKKINMLGCMYHESNKNQYVVVHVP